MIRVISEMAVNSNVSDSVRKLVNFTVRSPSLCDRASFKQGQAQETMKLNSSTKCFAKT